MLENQSCTKARTLSLPSCAKWSVVVLGLLLLNAVSVSAQTVGIGGYDLKSTADLSFAFDYNGTGKLDHVVLYRPGTGTVFILANEAGVFTPVFVSFTGIGGYDLRSPADRIMAFDYTGSGHADHLACYRPGTGTVFILQNNGGAFSPVFLSFNGIGGYDLMSPADQMLAFDYNGSGLYDHLVLYRPGAGVVFIVQNMGGVFSAIDVSTSGIGGYDLRSPADRLVAFDYYSIGTADHLLAYRPGAGVAFVLENASGIFNPVQISFAGIGGYDLRSTSDQLLPYDYSGTGNQDSLIAYRPGTGTAFVVRSAYFAFSPVLESTSGIGGYDLRASTDMAYTLDYNSSGLMDHLALYRPGSQVFFVEQNQGGQFSPISHN